MISYLGYTAKYTLQNASRVQVLVGALNSSKQQWHVTLLPGLLRRRLASCIPRRGPHPKQQKEMRSTLSGGWLANMPMLPPVLANNVSFWYQSVPGGLPASHWSAFCQSRPDVFPTICPPSVSQPQPDASPTFCQSSRDLPTHVHYLWSIKMCFYWCSQRHRWILFLSIYLKVPNIYVMRAITGIPGPIHTSSIDMFTSLLLHFCLCAFLINSAATAMKGPCV